MHQNVVVNFFDSIDSFNFNTELCVKWNLLFCIVPLIYLICKKNICIKCTELTKIGQNLYNISLKSMLAYAALL